MNFRSTLGSATGRIFSLEDSSILLSLAKIRKRSLRKSSESKSWGTVNLSNNLTISSWRQRKPPSTSRKSLRSKRRVSKAMKTKLHKALLQEALPPGPTHLMVPNRLSHHLKETSQRSQNFLEVYKSTKKRSSAESNARLKTTVIYAIKCYKRLTKSNNEKSKSFQRGTFFNQNILSYNFYKKLLWSNTALAKPRSVERPYTSKNSSPNKPALWSMTT